MYHLAQFLLTLLKLYCHFTRKAVRIWKKKKKPLSQICVIEVNNGFYIQKIKTIPFTKWPFHHFVCDALQKLLTKCIISFFLLELSVFRLRICGSYYNLQWSFQSRAETMTCVSNICSNLKCYFLRIILSY